MGPPVGSPRSERAGSGGRPAPSGPVAALLVGVAGIVIGAFLPWVVTGTTSRSSFATARSAERLGIVSEGAALVALQAWYLVPLAASLVLLLAALHRVRVAAAMGLVLAVVTALPATVVLAVAPERGVGPVVCLVGSCTVVASSVALLVHRRGSRPAVDPVAR